MPAQRNSGLSSVRLHLRTANNYMASFHQSIFLRVRTFVKNTLHAYVIKRINQSMQSENAMYSPAQVNRLLNASPAQEIHNLIQEGFSDSLPLSKWAELTRQYLVLQKQEYLIAAIQAASGEHPTGLWSDLKRRSASKSPGIVNVLRSLLFGSLPGAMETAPQLIKTLIQAGRKQDAATLILAGDFHKVALTERFKKFPLERQMEMAQLGIQAAQQSAQLAAALGYVSYTAHCHLCMGNALQEQHRFEEATHSYEEALQIRQQLAQQQPDNYLPDVAMTLNNLGLVLREQRRFEEATRSLEEALQSYRQLAQQQPDIYLPDVAMTLGNLGLVLRSQWRWEEATRSLEEALQIRRQLAQQQPDIYMPGVAATLVNLGTSLGELRRWEEATRSLEEALQIRRQLAQQQPDNYLPDVATTLGNLGNSLLVQQGLKKVTHSYEEALQIQRKWAQQRSDIYLPDVAMTLVNLGNSLREQRRWEEATRSLEEALQSYRQLAQQQPDNYLPGVAATLYNLGLVLVEQRRLGEATRSYEEALEIGKRFPAGELHLKLLSSLGARHFEASRIEPAIGYLAQAHELIETFSSAAVTPVRRRQIRDQHYEATNLLALCQTQQCEYTQALTIIEAGKGRVLNEMMAEGLSFADTVPVALRERFWQARQHVFEFPALPERQDEDNDQWGKVVNDYRVRRSAADTALLQVRDELRPLDSTFKALSEPLDAAEMQNLAKQTHTILAQFSVTKYGSLIYVIFPDGSLEAIQLPDFTLGKLEALLITIENEKEVGGWLVDYDSALRSKQLQNWFLTMTITLEEAQAGLMQPLHDLLQKRHIATGSHLVFVPTRGLSLLPLHACWWEEAGRRKYWLDEYVISYAPSLSILQRCQARRAERQSDDRLFGAANPRRDLLYTELECAEIEQLFGHENALLWHEAATKEAVLQGIKQASTLHFSCHGNFQLNDPLASALQMSDGELTMRDIMQQGRLSHNDLTVLSACETAQSDYRELADNHFTLASAFLCIGAPTVWATLWAVNDLSSSLLLIEAMQRMRQNNLSKAEALRGAQLWLRDATNSELSKIVEEKLNALGLSADKNLRRALQELSGRLNPKSDERPFLHPYYWAGFQSVGA